MLQQLLLHCYFMLYMNCWIFSSCASRTVGRCYSSIGLASHPYSDFLPFSPLYIASTFHLIQLHKCLVADVRLAGIVTPAVVCNSNHHHCWSSLLLPCPYSNLC